MTALGVRKFAGLALALQMLPLRLCLYSFRIQIFRQFSSPLPPHSSSANGPTILLHHLIDNFLLFPLLLPFLLLKSSSRGFPCPPLLGFFLLFPLLLHRLLLHS